MPDSPFPQDWREKKPAADGHTDSRIDVQSQDDAAPSTQSHSNNNDVLNLAQTIEYPKTWRLWLIVFALLLAMFLTALDLTIVATAIPRITDEFKSVDQVGWYGSAFFLTFASFQSAWGKSYKYFSLKPVFIAAVMVFEIGSLMCGAAQDSTTLIVGRALTGMGAGGVVGGTYTIMACIVPPNKAPSYISFIGVIFSVASVAGPLLGGVFTERLSWRWCFYINLPIGGVALAMVVFVFRSPAHAQPAEATLREKFLQMDIPGTGTVMAALLCYILALGWAGVKMPWNSPNVIGTLVGYILLSVLFVGIQWFQGERAAIVPRIINDRNAASLCAYISLNNMTTFLLLYYLPIYFQAIGNSSPSKSGVQNLPLILAMSISILVGARLVGIIGYFKPLLITGGIFLTIGAATIYTFDIGTSAGKQIGYQILLGIGNGISSQIPMISLQSFSKPSDIACTTATVLFFQLVSGAVSVAAAQSIFTNRLLANLPIYAPEVDPVQVLRVGASELRRAFPPEQLPGILESYVAGLKGAFAAGIGFAGLALIASLLPEWKRIHGKARGTIAV